MENLLSRKPLESGRAARTKKKRFIGDKAINCLNCANLPCRSVQWRSVDLKSASCGEWEEDRTGEVLDYAVRCDCGFFGMRRDCRQGECPNCGDRVKRERES